MAVGHGNSTPAYQWKWDDGAKSVHDVGTDSPTYDIPDVQSKAGDYWCEVTYDGVEYPSNTAVLGVAPILDISQQPAGAVRDLGESYTFFVVAEGGFAPLSYQWWKDGLELSGATDSSYDIVAIELADAGTYHVVVVDDNVATLTSDTADLTIPGAGMPAASLFGLGLVACALLGCGALAARKK